MFRIKVMNLETNKRNDLGWASGKDGKIIETKTLLEAELAALSLSDIRHKTLKQKCKFVVTEV